MFSLQIKTGTPTLPEYKTEPLTPATNECQHLHTYSRLLLINNSATASISLWPLQLSQCKRPVKELLLLWLLLLTSQICFKTKPWFFIMILDSLTILK